MLYKTCHKICNYFKGTNFFFSENTIKPIKSLWKFDIFTHNLAALFFHLLLVIIFLEFLFVCLFYLRSAHRTVAGLRLEAMAIPFSISDTGLVRVPGIPCPEFNKHYYEHIIPEFPIGHLIQIYNWIDRPAMRLCYYTQFLLVRNVGKC